MKSFILLLSLIVSNCVLSQSFVNGDLEGTISWNSAPPGWNQIPLTYANIQTTNPFSATSDVHGATGPFPGNGNAGNPQSGNSFVSGFRCIVSPTSTSIFDEGVYQTVSGFTVGQEYRIDLWQAVVQQNAWGLDKSGSWGVFVDNTLIATTAPTTTTRNFNDLNLDWEQRSVTFTACNTTHAIYFLPRDDDANLYGNSGEGVRMGLDNVSLTALAPPTPISINSPGLVCPLDAPFNLSATTSGGTWSGTGITNTTNGTFDPTAAGIGSHSITYTITYPLGCTTDGTLPLTINPCVLPVEFGTLRGLQKTYGIELNWNTLSELNSSHFVLERMDEGIFQPLTRVEAQGTTQLETLYKYVDREPSEGTNYYRLTGIDLDGSVSYTGTVAVNWKTEEISVYPNPASDEITIQLKDDRLKTIRIIAADGRIIESIETSASQLKWNVTNLPEGVYQMVIENEDGLYQTRFIKGN